VAQFGYLPGALWILVGCVLGGGRFFRALAYRYLMYFGLLWNHLAPQPDPKSISSMPLQIA